MSIRMMFHGRFRPAILGFLMMICAAGGVRSETETGEDAAMDIQQIVVTATRTEHELGTAPSSVSVVSGDDLARADATTIADALQDVPGIAVFDQSVPGAKRVQIRGESGSRVLVLIDGQKISEQKSMDGAALLIDPNRIARIEVIKGPASVLYGSEAIGGVVNIITKKGGTRPVQVEAIASYDTSSDGFAGYAAAFGGYKGFSYRLSGGWTDYHDRRTPEGTLDNTAYEIGDVASFLGYDTDTLSIGFGYDNFQSDANSHTPEGTTDDTLTYFQLDLPQWDREKFTGHVELRDLADWLPRLRANAYFQNTRKLFNNDMDITVRMGPAGTMRIENRITTDNDQDTLGGNFQIDWTPHDRHYVIIGYDPVLDRLDALTEIHSRVNSPMPPPLGSQTTPEDSFTYDAEMDTHGLYVQDEWSLPLDLTATLGFRQTWVSSRLRGTSNPALSPGESDDGHPVFSAGLTYGGVEHLTLRALFSQGYRFPNLQQLYIGTVHGSADPTFPNPDLNAEKSNNFEIGARFDNAALALNVAAFFSDAKDYISTALVSGGRQFTNVEKAETAGVEIDLSYTVADWGLSPYISGTFIQRKFTNDDFSTSDTGEPDLWGRAGLRYEREIGSNVALLSDLYARFATEAEEEFADGTRETHDAWETLNLTLGARFGERRQYFATLNLNNLLDQSYTTAQSSTVQPGFHAVLKAGLSF